LAGPPDAPLGPDDGAGRGPVDPAEPSRWASGAHPTPKRRLGLGCLGAIVVVAIAIAGLSRTEFGRGFGAALAIYDHGKPEVFRTNYAAVSGQRAVMRVYLSTGVDPGRGAEIGCGLVDDELHLAGLDGTAWVVYAANGQAVADSSVTCLQ